MCARMCPQSNQDSPAASCPAQVLNQTPADLSVSLSFSLSLSLSLTLCMVRPSAHNSRNYRKSEGPHHSAPEPKSSLRFWLSQISSFYHCPSEQSYKRQWLKLPPMKWNNLSAVLISFVIVAVLLLSQCLDTYLKCFQLIINPTPLFVIKVHFYWQ